MDSYLGSFPLDFIALYLDMSSEPSNEGLLPPAGSSVGEHISSENQPAINPESANKEGSERLPEQLPLSNLPSSSGNTEESITAFADQTRRTMASLDPSLDITFLSGSEPTTSHDVTELYPGKVLESEQLTRDCAEVQDNVEQQGTSGRFDVNLAESADEHKKNYFETDASEVEDLYDSADVVGLMDKPISSIVNSDLA